MARTLTALAMLSLATACGHAPAGSVADAGVAAPSGPHALWSADPESLSNPFPDARLVAADGGLGVRANYWQPFVPAALASEGGDTFVGYVDQLGASLAAARGFGNYGSQLVRFSDPMAPSSLGSAFAFVSLQGAAKVGPAASVGYQAGLYFAAVRPATPLAPKAPWALVLTSAATTAAGVPLVRSPDFDGWARSTGAATVGRLALALGVAPPAIVFASLFTTADVRADLSALAASVAAPGAPAAPRVSATPVTACPGGDPSQEECPRGVFQAGAGLVSTLAPWFDWEGWENAPTRVGTVVIGDVDLRDARDGEAGHFVPSVIQNPNLARTVSRQFVLAVPKGPAPAAGWPQGVAGHGLGGGNSVHVDANGQPLPSFCLAMAEFLAENGYGCIGIDAPSHQSRGSDLEFFDLQDLAVTRDYLRELVFDDLQLDRLLAAWPAGLHGVSIDAAHLSYVGQSLGSIVGASLLTLDPRLGGALLLVPGGGLADIVDSQVIGGEVDLLLAAFAGVSQDLPDGSADPDFTTFLGLVQSMGQALLEPADPIDHAAFLPAGRNALIVEGLDDHIVPNATTDALAAALGIPTLTRARRSPSGVSGLWKYDLTHYGLDPTQSEPHFVFSEIPGARAQGGAYLESFETSVLAE